MLSNNVFFLSNFYLDSGDLPGTVRICSVQVFIGRRNSGHVIEFPVIVIYVVEQTDDKFATDSVKIPTSTAVRIDVAAKKNFGKAVQFCPNFPTFAES